MLGENDNTRRRMYFRIKDGNFVHKNNETGEDKAYRFILGYVTDITEKTNVFNGEEVKRWEVWLRDDQDPNMFYNISTNKGSVMFINLFNSIANIDDLQNTPIKISAYQTEDKKYTRLSVEANEEKVLWKYSDMPKAKDVYVPEANITVKSTVERDAFAAKIINEILEKLGKASIGTQDTVQPQSAPAPRQEPIANVQPQQHARQTVQTTIDDLPF